MSVSCVSSTSCYTSQSQQDENFFRNFNQLDMQKSPTIMKTGSFGATIHYARLPESRFGIAVKKYWIDQTNEENGEDMVKCIGHEVASMKMLKHPNVLTCLASLVVNQEVWVITPLMEYGSVSTLLASGFPDGLPEMICCFILRDILTALQYLHQQGVVHRSVRCSHILISGKGEAVLSGFRYSTSLHATGEHRNNLYDYPLHGVTSNLFWLAPEILKQNLLGYSETSDIYSLGVASCEMANGVVPYSDFPSTLMLIEKLRGSSPRLLDFATLSAAQNQEEQELSSDPQGAMEGMESAGPSSSNNGGRGNLPPPPGGTSSSTGQNAQQGQQGQTTTLADSGVGESVGSCNNMLGKNSSFYNREFSPHFHDFVAECTISCGEERPGASQLLQHPWIKQLKKTNVTLLTLFHSVRPIIVGGSEVRGGGSMGGGTAGSRSTIDKDDLGGQEDEGLIVEQMQGLLVQENLVSWDFD